MSPKHPLREAMTEAHTQVIEKAERLGRVARNAFTGQADADEMFAAHHEYMHAAQAYFTSMAVAAAYGASVHKVLDTVQSALTH